MTFDRFDVVIVPFPFTDRAQQKRRPALVLSDVGFNKQSGHSVMAMITSVGNTPWPLDAKISNLKAARLAGGVGCPYETIHVGSAICSGKSGAIEQDRSRLCRAESSDVI